MPPAKPLLLSLALLTLLAYLRPPEYDESYSIFLTTPHFHPPWPTTPFTPAQTRPLYLPNTSFAQIAAALRSNDVHPPLYFWLLLIWRDLFGPAWFTARLLSVLLATAALATLAQIATHLRIPPTKTILLCLTTYAFTYTSLLARNFALANLITLLGLLLTLRHCKRAEGACEATQKPASPWLAGLTLGAATFTNDLTLFPALTTLAHLTLTSPRRSLPGLAAFALFLPPDAYFFAAQHASRPTQFPLVSLPQTLTLLAKDSAAAWFGAIPLDAPRFAPEITTLLILLAAACLLQIARTQIPHKPLLIALTLATPTGLLALALAFHTTPIEIRYLAPSAPYLALLLAASQSKQAARFNPPTTAIVMARPDRAIHAFPAPKAVTEHPASSIARRKKPFAPRVAAPPATNPPAPKSFLLLFSKKEALAFLLFATQSLATSSLTLTSQPFAAAARQAAALATPATLILLPYGNDGTGIPGPFIASAPAAMRILLIHPGHPPNLAAARRLILVTVTPDASSRTAIAQTLARLAAAPCWQPQTATRLVRLYRATCPPP